MNDFRIKQAARVLKAGGIVAYPTEGVWGLGVDPCNALAIQKLLQVKGRSVQKGLILLAADLDQIAPWLNLLTVDQRAQVEQTWPGPVTWLIPNQQLASKWVVGAFSSIAIRVTAHPEAAALSRAFGGAIISTSANLSGHKPARFAWAFGRDLRKNIDMVLAGELGGQAGPSEIRDLLTNQTIR